MKEAFILALATVVFINTTFVLGYHTPRALGEPCSISQRCGQGLRCRGICKEIRYPGQTCNEESLDYCWFGYCDNGICYSWT